MDFENRLKASDGPVQVFAAWLQYKGYEVSTPDLSLQGPDSGDILVHTSDLGWVRLEIKGLSAEFKDSWPWDSIIICGKESHDRAMEQEPAPFAYVLINRDLTGACIVHTMTQVQWWEDEQQDAGRGADYRQRIYRAPVEAARIISIGGN